MLRRASYLIPLLVCAPALRAQAPGADTVAVLAAVHARVVAAGPTLGPATWPGFRPDTIPHVYVIPGRGALLFGWTGALPQGWVRGADGAAWLAAADRGAASTGIQLEGRGAAQVVVNRLHGGELAGLTLHESFHVFQRASRVEGRRFGAGENSMLLSTYPVFDVENEALTAVEGRRLADALLAPDGAAAARAARRFLAVRTARQARLPREMVEFEDAAELNEGLAEYALHRGAPSDSARGALVPSLDGLVGDGGLSLRLRFYGTGSGMAYLLDRIAGRDWKRWMMDDDLTLQAALTRAAGAARTGDALPAARVDREMAAVRERAARVVAERRADRGAQADRVLAAPGVVLRIVPDRLGRGLDPCGFDPQNLLQVDESRWLHTRWLRACTSGVEAEFNAPVVQDGTVLTAVAGPQVRITVRGAEVALAEHGGRVDAEEVRIESAGVTVTAARADVAREGRTITIHPLPPE